MAKDLWSLPSVIIGNDGTSQYKMYEVNKVSLNTSVINLVIYTAQKQSTIFESKFDV